MEYVVEALETARLVDLEGIAVFLEVTTGDAGGFIQRCDIAGSAIVDARFGASENVELIYIDSGAFGDLDAGDGLSTTIESRRSGTC